MSAWSHFISHSVMMMPHPGAGLVTGVVPHMHPGPEHPLLVLDGVARAL